MGGRAAGVIMRFACKYVQIPVCQWSIGVGVIPVSKGLKVVNIELVSSVKRSLSGILSAWEAYVLRGCSRFPYASFRSVLFAELYLLIEGSLHWLFTYLCISSWCVVRVLMD